MVGAEYDFDVIVIGGGAGGAAFASACASAGKSVLIVERGPRTAGDPQPRGERQTFVEKLPYDDRAIEVNESPLRLFMGGVLGGGTSVYGAAMLRPSREDFTPGRHYGTLLDRSLWEWSVGYEELEPFYDEAEELFQLASNHEDDFGPLERPKCRNNSTLLPLAPINQRLIARSREHGLRPFRLPLAIDTQRCERCSACAGFLCPNGARRSAAAVIQEIVERQRVHVMVNAEVEQLLLDRGGPRTARSEGGVRGVVIRDRRSQSSTTYRAPCYALAAGAIGSPAIALKSGLEGPQVGRNYMMHYSPLAAGVFAKPTGGDESFIKQVGFADFYFGTPDYRRKMGIVQSLPVPGPLMLRKTGMRRWPAGLVGSLRRRLLPLVGIVEDLPDPRNRVFLKESGAIALAHQFSRFDRLRGAFLAKAMRRVLRRAGAVIRLTKQFPSQEHVAHQCGTLRMGADPRSGAVDADCRMFGAPNLFVVDGSVLPTSLGVGPSLTIIANALRVARIACRDA
ncbi:MAG: 6-hydroxyparomomycin oxidase [Planctomycetota bacterium]|jgi:choline dehydrogenase-like flavoprotein